MMFKYPMSFKAHAKADHDIQRTWAIASDASAADCAIPPEFGGPGGAFSPEDLFALALTNCFVATFKVYAHASKIEFATVQARADLTVDLGPTRKPIMKKLTLHVQITGATQPERLRTLAEKAFSSGFILNSVKTELALELDIQGV